MRVYLSIMTAFASGFKCQLFVMDLTHYKLYRFIMLEQFYLPRDIYDFHSLVSCFRRMDGLEVCVIYAFVSFLCVT